MEFKNHTTGDVISIRFRPFEPRDVEALMEGFQEAYGDTYVKSCIYSKEALLEQHKNKTLVFVVAETEEGELAGVIARESNPLFPGQKELSAQVVRQKFNGYGLATALIRYQMSLAKEGEDALFAKPLGCHTITQRTLEENSFTPCGFILSVFDGEKFRHRYQPGRSPKISQSVAVWNHQKRSTALAYMPESLIHLAEPVYRQLGFPTQFLPATGFRRRDTAWVAIDSEEHATRVLFARDCGEDFRDSLFRHMGQVAKIPRQTINLYLNISSPGAQVAYQEARGLGFIFSAFFPGSRGAEYIILHNPLSLEVDVDDLLHIPSYHPFIEEIGRQYNERG